MPLFLRVVCIPRNEGALEHSYISSSWLAGPVKAVSTVKRKTALFEHNLSTTIHGFVLDQYLESCTRRLFHERGALPVVAL